MDEAFERLAEDDIRSVLDIGRGIGRLSLELAKGAKDAIGVVLEEFLLDGSM